MDFKTTFKFYAVEHAPYIGAYRCGSLNNGEPQIMFAMDFHTWTLKDTPKEELSADFKDGMLQTITHEFCHAMQEMLDKDYDELEVEQILGAYKPTWNVFDAPAGEEMPETDDLQPNDIRPTVLHKANVISSATPEITCTARNCTKPAVGDYNGHGDYACQYHMDKWNNYFDDEYR